MYTHTHTHTPTHLDVVMSTMLSPTPSSAWVSRYWRLSKAQLFYDCLLVSLHDGLHVRSTQEETGTGEFCFNLAHSQAVLTWSSPPPPPKKRCGWVARGLFCVFLAVVGGLTMHPARSWSGCWYSELSVNIFACFPYLYRSILAIDVMCLFTCVCAPVGCLACVPPSNFTFVCSLCVSLSVCKCVSVSVCMRCVCAFLCTGVCGRVDRKLHASFLSL